MIGRPFLVLLFCGILSFTVQAQVQISGNVHDQNGTTLSGAHVFLNGTTHGTLTNKEGTFKITKVPEGVYQLVVKFLGYKDFITQINTSSANEPLQIVLQEDVYDLEEITVISDRKQWQERFDIFRDHFLGTSKNAENSKILNPEVVSFNKDPDTGILTAEASNRLRIENDALGYRIEFYLKQFSYDSKNGASSYFGFPIFTEMSSNRRRTNRRWNRNREKTYKGSFEHFISTLINKNYYQSGYEIRAEMRKSSKEIAKDSSLSAEINANYHQQKNIFGGARYLSKDTVKISNIFSQIDSNTYELQFINFLNVTYLEEFETFEYQKWQQGILAVRKPDPNLPQNSVITLTADSLQIHSSGYIYNPTDYMVGGYWAFERLADLLPINYRPEE